MPGGLALTTRYEGAPLPVVAVVDTGVDDALALLVAVRHPALDLRGVICTAGNVPLERVWANTLYVLRLLGADVVTAAAGADRRLDGRPFPVRGVHGPDGLAGLGPPADAGRPPVPGEPAPVPPGAVVVSLGPLTALNALGAVRVVASYARPGEANHAMDPAAAAQVAVEHMDVPPHPMPGIRTVEALGRSAGPVARLAAGLLRHQATRGAGLGDAAVVLRLAEPDLPPDEWAGCVVSLCHERPLR